VLEKAALEFAFKRNRRRLFAKLEKNIASMRAAVNAGDGVKYREFDEQFHKTFFEFCDNSYLRNSYSLMEARIAALRVYVTIPRPSEVDSSYSEHVLIVSHLKDGDLAQALNVLEVHISRAGALYPIFKEVEREKKGRNGS
jgi:DNA-binding GntR family transcriptional regulator